MVELSEEKEGGDRDVFYLFGEDQQAIRLRAIAKVLDSVLLLL
jgi:hypothetical protein